MMERMVAQACRRSKEKTAGHSRENLRIQNYLIAAHPGDFERKNAGRFVFGRCRCKRLPSA